VQKVHTLPLPLGTRGASDLGMGDPRTRHPMRFWVVRRYKISSHRSAGTERTINLFYWVTNGSTGIPAIGIHTRWIRLAKVVLTKPG